MNTCGKIIALVVILAMEKK